MACVGLAGLRMPDDYHRFTFPLQDSVVQSAVTMIKAYSDPGIPPALRVLRILRDHSEEPGNDGLVEIVAQTF